MFEDSPFNLLHEAFSSLFPNRNYVAKIAPQILDDVGNEVLGETIFPDDGTPPVVSISCNLKIIDAVEIFAHELAHVAVGMIDDEHGPAWETAFDGLFVEYNRIGQEKFG